MPFDKLYWLRIGFGAVAGALADWISGLDTPNALWNGITVALGFYLASYYLARYVLYRKLGREYFGKFYTTGIGGFVMVFIFTWIALFTLSAFLHFSGTA